MREWILTSSLLILAVLLIRVAGRDRLSARVRYALWALVLLRLLMPFSVGESILSVQNLMQKTVSAEVQTEPILISDIIETTQTSETIEIPMIPIAEGESSRTYIYTPVLIWALGSIITALIFIISNLRFAAQLRRSRQTVMQSSVPVYVTEAVETPCLFGLWKPAIYVTPEVWENKTALRHVLAHELTHYRHKDHIWSVLRCVCVCVHWFNPLVWAADILSQKDAEMDCDEGTLVRFGAQERTGYAKTLVDLTCVGYKGVLTAATSMTGSESDLKQRVMRIVKNPKMSAIAVIVVLVVAIVAALAAFTGAKASSIEGVWRVEETFGGTEMPSGDIIHEFYNGYGRRTDYIDGTLHSSRTFRYKLEDNTLTINYDDPYEVFTCAWRIDDGKLIMGEEAGSVSIPWEYSSVPYLPEGYWEYSSVSLARPNENLWTGLTDTQEAKLLDLLRKGEGTETRRESADNMPYMVNFVLTNGKQQHEITIANGLVYTDDQEVGYVLSNIDEIEYWIQTLIWSGRSVQVSGFEPEDLRDIASARMILYDRAYPADPSKLAFLEELLTTAEPLGYTSGCPFDGMIEITLADGRVLGIEPALDSCATFLIWDICYEYGNQFETDDEGSYDNSELLAVFGLTPTMLEEIIISNMQPVEGAVIGTNADVGDVVRILDDVMEPAFLSIEGLKTMQSLLWLGLGDAIGTEEVTWDKVYYSILNSDLPNKEDVVFLSDNGSLYMDGVRYELSTADELLEHLDAIFNEFRITRGGEPIFAVREAVGSTVYLELRGVTEDADVIWTSEYEDVCTVSGDARGCTIIVTGGGVSNVKAEWNDGDTVKSASVAVYCDKMG